ncbi:hypothetical protein L1887_59881 [Cichorium endivia]|nr:hypothetical protein L1887_59881 [Cichorium endivia]
MGATTYLELDIGLGTRIQLEPLLVSAPLDPLLVRVDLHPAAHGAHGVDLAKVGARDEAGNVDLGHIHALVIPEGIGERRATMHLGKVFDAVVTLDDERGDQVKVAHVEPAAAAELLAEDIAGPLPWRDRLERRRVLCGCVPLRDGEVRVSGHAHVAVAPWELCELLDHVVDVLGLLRAEHERVTVAIAGPARIDAGNRISREPPTKPDPGPRTSLVR